MLYQIGFNASGIMTTASGTTRNLANNVGNDNAGECSPLTEIFNSTTGIDWLFLSVANNCNATGGGAAGCAQNFQLPTSGFPGAAVAGCGRVDGNQRDHHRQREFSRAGFEHLLWHFARWS